MSLYWRAGASQPSRPTGMIFLCIFVGTFLYLQVNVRDSSYTSQVEAVLAGKDFYSFVTLTKEDKSTLLKEVQYALSAIANEQQCERMHVRVILL